MDSIDIRTQRTRIENIGTLPTMPGTLKKISAVIGKPGVTLNELSRFVASDPSLTTKVLKMINSAVYGFPGRIASVSHAIMLLGLNVVKGLLLGISVFEIMQQVMGGLWEHSFSCAVAARAIAEKKGVKDPEEVSVAALLHDFGKVIMLLEFQPAYQAAIQVAEAGRVSISEAERALFQESHPAIGMWLAEKWRFPPPLVEVIACHHRPEMARQSPLETAIVHFSDALVRARGFGFAGDPFVPSVHPVALERLALGDADIREVLQRMEDSHEDTQGLMDES